MKNSRKRILVTVLTLTLTASLALSGCSSLSSMIEDTASNEESAPVAELTRVLRTGDSYKDIEIFHGTKEEPCYSPDNKGYFYEEQGWIYLHVEGKPDARGYQQGWLLADYIELQIDHNVSMLAKLQSLDWEYLRVNAERMWNASVSDEYRAELEGIVAGAAKRGASFDYLDLLVMNGLEELRDCWFPTVSETYYLELAAGLWDPQALPVDVTMQVIPSEDDAEEDSENADENAEDTTSEDVATEDEGSSEEKISSSDNNASDEEDSDAKDEDESTDDDAEEKDDSPESHIATIPYVETEGVTGFTNTEAIQTTTTPASRYTKQSIALLATGKATEDGGVILVQNTLAAYADSNFSNVMVDVVPTEGERFTMQSAPGFIHSVGEAYSTTSLVIANTRIVGFDVYSEQGIPEFLRIRQAVQYAKTLDDFTNRMIAGTNGGLASNWLVGDVNTNQIMELELGLSYYNVQKLLDGCFISFGGVDDTRILNGETDGTGTTDVRRGNGARYDRVADLYEMNYGKIDTKIAQTILSDHVDSYLSKSHAGSRSICAHSDLDDAQFAPENSAEPFMPYGTMGAKVMSSKMAQEHTLLARWGYACGREFNATSYLEKHTQFSALQDYLYDRPAGLWAELAPLNP